MNKSQKLNNYIYFTFLEDFDKFLISFIEKNDLYEYLSLFFEKNKETRFDQETCDFLIRLGFNYKEPIHKIWEKSLGDFLMKEIIKILKSTNEYLNFRIEVIRGVSKTYYYAWYSGKPMWWRFYYALLYDSSLRSVISTYVLDGNRLIYRLRDVIKYKMQPIKNKQ